jgi:hypothetical protein
MMCDRYWREGIVLVERGLDDAHREGCADCTRAHASRRELIEALPLIGASYTGDPHWQANVWRRIDGVRAHTPWRWRWQLDAVLTLVCVVALWIGLGRTRPVDSQPQPQYEIVGRAGAVTMRSGSGSGSADDAHVDDRLRVTVGEISEVWIYRAERLVLRCRARQVSDGCAPDAHGMIVEMVLSIPGPYQVIVTEGPVAPPRGKLDEDRAALETVGAHYEKHGVLVH